MKIGILQVALRIGDALNLREKNRVLKSVKDRWRHRHNISVAEVDYLEHPQHTMLGIAMVGSDRRYLESALAKLVEDLKNQRRVELLDFQIEIIG